MNIDWITVSAQIVNFLILVWLLKRFLYQPVIDIMNEREASIAGRLSDAEEREAEAEEEARKCQEQREALERDREDILAETKEEARALKKDRMNELRDEVNETRAEWQQQVQDEKSTFLNNLQSSAAATIQRIAARALSDLANVDLETQIINRFVEQLADLDEATRDELLEASDTVRVVTAFEPDANIQRRVTRALHEQLSQDLEIDYQVSPDILCGIEVRADGQKLSWQSADYLDELNERVNEAMAVTRTRSAEDS